MKKKILVVDDNLPTLVLFAAALREYEVYKVSDSCEAIGAFKEIEPDVVILDCRMPDIDGFTIAREIKKISKVKMALMSATVFERAEYEDCCDTFFQKPLKFEMIKEFISN